MSRFVRPLLITVSWLFLIGAASLQTGGGDGWPPQTQLYQDAQFLARIVPFLIALGIVVGIYQARVAAKEGGDAILGDQVLRHDSGVIIAHWFNAVGLILGLVSGAIVLRWVERPPEVRWVFIIHYIGAALTIFAISNHLARHGVSGGTGLIPKSFGVIRDVIGEVLGYMGLFGPEAATLRIPWPKAIRAPIARYVRALLGYKESRTGKYLATEQLLSYTPWTILIATITITGLIKSLRYAYAIPSALVASATAIHDLTAVGIGVMLVIHMLPLLLVPANWPLLMSIFRTKVPLEYVKKRHPLWYQQLVTGKGQPEAVPGTRRVPSRPLVGAPAGAPASASTGDNPGSAKGLGVPESGENS